MTTSKISLEILLSSGGVLSSKDEGNFSKADSIFYISIW